MTAPAAELYWDVVSATAAASVVAVLVLYLAVGRRGRARREPPAGPEEPAERKPAFFKRYHPD